jgi:hypothetical protein
MLSARTASETCACEATDREARKIAFLMLAMFMVLSEWRE